MDQQVVFLRDRGRVTIPASVREEYGLEEGTALILAKEKDRLVLYLSSLTMSHFGRALALSV